MKATLAVDHANVFEACELQTDKDAGEIAPKVIGPRLT